MTGRIGLVAAVVAASAVSACVKEEPSCETVAVFGINITVSDSVTGATFPFSNVFARAVDGTYRDSLFQREIINTFGAPPKLNLAEERPGTYDVTVTADGYKTWTKTGVAVPKQGCHVVKQLLDARLAK